MKKWLKRVKRNFNERLEKLAEENRQMYGGKRLDCCNVNRVNQKSAVRKESPKVGK
jgi:hypothetical protein